MKPKACISFHWMKEVNLLVLKLPPHIFRPKFGFWNQKPSPCPIRLRLHQRISQTTLQVPQKKSVLPHNCTYFTFFFGGVFGSHIPTWISPSYLRLGVRFTTSSPPCDPRAPRCSAQRSRRRGLGPAGHGPGRGKIWSFHIYIYLNKYDIYLSRPIVYIYMCIFCVCMYIYMYAYIYIYISYIYIYVLYIYICIIYICIIYIYMYMWNL